MRTGSSNRNRFVHVPNHRSNRVRVVCHGLALDLDLATDLDRVFDLDLEIDPVLVPVPALDQAFQGEDDFRLSLRSSYDGYMYLRCCRSQYMLQ